MYIPLFFNYREAENGDVWYYTASQQFQELLNVLDANEMEAPLVRELIEMKQEILRQMNVTGELTEQAKGNRKSYLEVEISNILKKKMAKDEQRQIEPNKDIKLDDKDDSEISLHGSDVFNEVTITSDEIIKDENDGLDSEDTKRNKNNCLVKTKSLIQKKGDDGKFFMQILNYKFEYC